MTHWRAGDRSDYRGANRTGPRFEHNTRSNVIHVSFAGHQSVSPPDDRSTSGAPVAAAPFIQDPFEFGSWVFAIAFFTAPSVFVGGAILFYALMVA